MRLSPVVRAVAVGLAFTLSVAAPASGSAAAEGQGSSFRDRVKAAIDVGVKHLRFQQDPDGSWNDDTEATALILRATMDSHRQYREADGPFVRNSLRFLADSARDDGALGDGSVYGTALAVLVFERSENPEYEKLAAAGIEFIASALAESAHGLMSRGADPAQLALVLDALNAAGLKPDHGAWKATLGILEGHAAPDSPALLHATVLSGKQPAEGQLAAILARLGDGSLLGSAGSPRPSGSFRDIYFVSATLDATSNVPEVVTPTGRVPWHEVVAERLMELQVFDGYWEGNGDPAEADRMIASPFALLALEQIYNE
jgi:hypothetical protein